MAGKMSDAYKEDKNFNLERLFPSMCLPVNNNIEELDSDDLCIHN